ncbi:erythromycin esterase family protein [Metabacillus herbersteinensis]|uniref:Erythromycin esterase family protein n=1 Tax=Metabacillus herbersteinensis TaxID=283816 RepID=A0ABV6GDF5_9BACI
MTDTLIEAIKNHANAIHATEDLIPLIDEIKDEQFVLLGESSHGTSEFYKIRAELSKKLIVEKEFTFLAVEGDWPACQKINRYIKGFDQVHKNARDVLKSFNRWPTWMWANEEMIDLIEWLKDYNHKQSSDKKVGFYGIDIYSLWESMDEIIRYLEKINSPDREAAKKMFSCFEPFNRQPEKYGVSAAFYSEGCHDEVIKLLTEIRLNKNQYVDSEESRLNLEVNALITANAENYYRTMVVDGNESWNIRDRHMVEVINKISGFYGSNAKGIIWEHNTHVGDARATDMVDEGIVNVGQLLREQKGKENLFIIGFGTHHGTVIAADQWGVEFERMITPPAQIGSFEDAMHKAGADDKFIHFNDKNNHLFNQKIGHRAIGVVYNPAHEHYGNYVPSVMSERYDAFIYVNFTNALNPLKVERVTL